MSSKASKAQIKASRRNAQSSTGPSTPQGKAVASLNSVKHGLTANQTVIRSENQAEFDFHRAQLLDELAPDTPIEYMLADQIVTLSWKLKRIGYIQNQTIDAMLAKNTSSPLAKLTQSLLAKYVGSAQTEPSEPDPELALGRLAIKDFSNSRVLEKLLMYERRTESSLYRTLLELQRLNMIKKLKAGHENQNEPKTNPNEPKRTQFFGDQT